MVCPSCSTERAPAPGYDTLERVCDRCGDNGKKKSPSIATLLMSLLCKCVESPEETARRERRKSLTDGVVLTRKRGILYSKQKVKIVLTEQGSLVCTPMDPALASSEEEFQLCDVGSCEVRDPQGLVLKSSEGTTLLELEGSSSAQCEQVCLTVTEAMRELPFLNERLLTKRASDGAEKGKKKNVELATRQAAAAMKKVALLGKKGGNKYSALGAKGASGSTSTASSEEGLEY